MKEVFIPESVPSRLREASAELLRDRDRFLQLVQIKNKQTQKMQPFVPNEAQHRLWAAMDEHRRVIVLKARQVGISTAVRAWQFHQAFVSKDPLSFAVLSFHDRSAKNLRRMDRRWLAGLPKELSRPLEVDSADETIFDDTKAGFSSFTTSGRGGTRSFDFSGAHLSEFAFYEDPEEVLAQSLSTVGDGPLVVESTVNQPGDKFHQLIEGAPENGWYVFTYWWWQHAAYSDPNVPEDFKLTEEEARLREAYDLTLGQLWWRRQQVSTLGASKFRREYPACLADAFASRDSVYFEAEDLDAIDTVWFDRPEREFMPPDEGQDYVMGVDPAGGVGGDYSAMVVLELQTLQPVYIWRSNTISPVEFAERVVTVAMRYNNAFVLCESNNHGHVVNREMQRLRYTNVYADARGRPWVTTVRSKLEAYEALKEHIRGRLLFRLDQTTLQELRSLQVEKVTPAAPVGLHDDLAMALALAYRAVRAVPFSKRRERLRGQMDELILKARADRIRKQPLPWRTQ